MRALRILVNNIELDHVREDARIRNENSSFTDNIKLQHTTRPIRIEENQAAVDAFGEFTLTSAYKKKFFPCKVVQGAVWYNGILTQKEKISGFRKFDLKFGSAVNSIMEKKIGTFFPEFNVTGMPDYPQYSDESAAPHDAGQAWIDHAQDLKGKFYPEVKWSLPQMSWRGKFGFDLKKEDTHYQYRGNINNYRANELMVNTPAVLSNYSIGPKNVNVISPQVFALSPLYFAFKTLGYVLTGNLVKDSFFKRLLLLSTADNMTLVIQKYPGVVIDLSTLVWEQVYVTNIIGLLSPAFAKKAFITADKEGQFKLRYNLRVPFDGMPYFGLDIFVDGVRIDGFTSSSLYEVEGEIPVTIDAAQVGKTIEVRYHTARQYLPEDYHLEFAEDLPDLEFHDQHPTIDFSRYIPDWTVAEYLNNLKNTFNLKIEIDDVTKEVRMNFNEKDYLINGEILPIRKSLQVAGFKNIPSESYLLKFANDNDSTAFFSKDPTAVPDGNTKELTSEFKYVPHTDTARLSEEVEDKGGVGLMLLSPGSILTTDTLYGRSLTMDGPTGIANSFWRRWILFRLNASGATLKGPFTQTELFLMDQRKKIYIDHQLWLVKAVEYKENHTGMYEADIDVESVSY